MSVKIIDGYVVSPIESLKAEWLYSQGKGRSFRVGEQQPLAQYLSQTCPLSGEALENENERKLRLILCKAQQHQRQLQEQGTSSGGSPATTPNNSSTNNSPSSNRRKGPSRIQSPRSKLEATEKILFILSFILLVSRLTAHHRPATADAVMSSSFHGTSMTTSHIEAHSHSNQLLEMTKSLIENFTSDSLMTQSLDPTILAGSSLNSSMTSSIREPHPSTMNNGNLYNEQSSIPIVQSSGPLVTASKMMPVPESLMSPDCGPPMIIQQRPVSALTTSARNIRVNQQRPASSPASSNKSPRALKKPDKSSPSNSPRKAMANTTNTKIHQNQSILKQTTHQLRQSETATSVATTEDEDDEEINIEKRKTKTKKQLENSHQKIENKEVEKSAILIQKLWRGYSTRKRTVADISENLQQKRTQDYIVKLTEDMEMTKQALENERKIQQLQMQAINALWKKVSNMQTIPENTGENGGSVAAGLGGQDIVQDLTKTCSMLTNQVQQLQVSMRDILNCMTVFAQLPHMQSTSNSMTSSGFRDSSETQTEIIAVHTPQIEHPKDFPFVQKIQRPSSLPICSSNDSSTSTRTSNTATTGDELEAIKECNGDQPAEEK